MMTPELKIYMMALEMPSLMDELGYPMNPKTKQSFLRVTQFCEAWANGAADAFYKHETLKERHDAMVNDWCKYIDEYSVRMK